MKKWLPLLLLFVLSLAGLALWRALSPPASTEKFALRSGQDGGLVVASASSAAAIGAILDGAQAAQPKAAAEASAGAAVWDLCGIGRVPVPASAKGTDGGLTDLPNHLGEAAHQQARQALLAAMSQGDARSRAAALVWQRHQSYAAAYAASAPPSTYEPSTALRSAILSLAEENADATIAAWALSTCQGDRACRQRASDTWLRLEPGNAVARLTALGQHPAQAQDALQAVIDAPQFNSHLGALAAQALAAMPSGIPAYVQSGLLVEALGLDLAIWDTDSWRDLNGLCKSPIPTNSAQETRCKAVASLLVARSDTLIGYQMGSRIGERAGWPKAQEEARREQANALVSSSQDFHVMEQPRSCEALQFMRQWVKDLVSKGEMVTMRERVAANKAAK
jgi:hypothetical protein